MMGDAIESARNAAVRMTLKRAIGIYMACLAGALVVLLPIVVAVGRWTRPGYGVLLFLLLHLSLGVLLNRVVLRGLVEWHLLATLEGVARRKLGFVMFWPVRYPVLFGQIGVDRLI